MGRRQACQRRCGDETKNNRIGETSRVNRIYHQSETLQGQSSKQRRYICRSENDLRRATTIAQREKGLSDVVRAASPVGQDELFAIQFRERKLARYRTREHAENRAGIDQKFKLDCAPARLARIGNGRFREGNFHSRRGPFCAAGLMHSRSKAGGSQSCHDHSDAYAAAMSALARGSSRIPPPIRFIA